MEKEKLNVYQKLQKCRTELQKKNLKKSGSNKFAGFNYFELSDFLPTVNDLFYENGLCSMFNLHQETETASLEIINVDNLEDRIVFEAPVAEANIKGCTPIQSLGGQITYLRRYLYMNALEIVESDMFDSKTGDMEVEVKKTIKKATPKQIELINQLVSDIPAMLNYYKIEKVEDLPMNVASQIIKKKQGEQ